MDELLTEFLTETNENLGVLDVELVKLEQNPDNPRLLDNIFRLVHTIKGTCGFLGLPRLERVAHASENVLGKIRDGEIEVTPDAVTLILQALDRIKELLAHLEETEAEAEGDDAELITQLNAMAAGTGGVSVAEPAKAVADAADPPPNRGADPATSPGDGGEDSVDELEAAFLAAPGPEQLTKAEADSDTTPPAPSESDDAASGKTDDEAAGPDKASVANQTIRVSVDHLENLMTMVSELVLTRNQLMQMVRGLNDSEFNVPLQRLSHLTTDLQEGVMKTRMQPIGNAWAKLPRIVRDIGHELSKKVDLQMLGADTELDRQVLELIKDPLTHMVRNAVDHGLEGPEERIEAGKPETGRITLNAFHEGGHIIIEISDDGRGLPVDKIGAKAVANGLANEGELAAMSDQQILRFIFRPGFSTAAKVTNVSGRGVGMDVVRTNIEKIGGTVELKSQEGKFTAFTIKIPLTLAIVSALIVACDEQRFAIPQLNVVELVSIGEDSEYAIETINETPVLRLRERLLPLVSLRQVLGLPATHSESGRAPDAFVIVSQVGTYTCGIVVDQVFDTEEIVVKPAAPILRHIDIYSGNTILGDGSVIMILDANGIAATSDSARAETKAEDTAEERREGAVEERVPLLIFRAGDTEPKAVPLALVARLEEIPVEDIEFADGAMVVQYRGRLMPLIKLDGNCAIRDAGRQPVLVFADQEHIMGLVVDEIVDIVEERLDVELTAKNEGRIGTAVVNGQATGVIDVTDYLTRAFGEWFKAGNGSVLHDHAGSRRVLLVDDSSFFRNLLAPVLSSAGYDVTTAEDAGSALELREGGESFDIIISDIEMPGMDGFQFATEVRNDERWQTTPIVALSSHTSSSDLSRGREVGFADYVAKFDRDALLNSLTQTLHSNGGRDGQSLGA